MQTVLLSLHFISILTVCDSSITSKSYTLTPSVSPDVVEVERRRL